MNPRRVHALMASHFPKVDYAKRSWLNLLERDGSLRAALLDALMDEFIDAEEVLVELDRKRGDLLAKSDVARFIAQQIGVGTIRISDRAFLGYVLIASNGVATGWSS